MRYAEEIREFLEEKGLDVLVDDREERPGFKFKDADLLGLPLRVTIGERGLAKGEIEIKERSEKDFEAVSVEEAAEKAYERIQKMRELL